MPAAPRGGLIGASTPTQRRECIIFIHRVKKKVWYLFGYVA
jgi:hypothetical protein